MNKIDALIKKLEHLQISEDGGIFRKGMFPSERFHTFLPYVRKDSNIFFPASIALILLKNIRYLDQKQSEKVNKIIHEIRSNYEFYSNSKYNYLYNFYQTKPDHHYPNGFILSKFKHFILADDADCTAIISMTLDNHSMNRVDMIREKLVQFSNLQQKKIEGVDSVYAELNFYATWFGSGKMPIELEVCVLCNILIFTFTKNVTLNLQDKESLELIKRAIDNNDIVKNPFQISGVYPNTSVILYHITRLCTIISTPEQYFDTERLIEMIRSRLKTTSMLEKIILSISLLNLGQACEPIDWEFNNKRLQKDFNTFPFFVAPMLSGNTNKLLAQLKKHRLFHILFRCDAFYYTLLLEYEIKLKQQNILMGKTR